MILGNLYIFIYLFVIRYVLIVILQKYIIIKMTEIKDKERILKAARDKRVPYKETLIRL